MANCASYPSAGWLSDDVLRQRWNATGWTNHLIVNVIAAGWRKELSTSAILHHLSRRWRRWWRLPHSMNSRKDYNIFCISNHGVLFKLVWNHLLNSTIPVTHLQNIYVPTSHEDQQTCFDLPLPSSGAFAITTRVNIIIVIFRAKHFHNGWILCWQDGTMEFITTLLRRGFSLKLATSFTIIVMVDYCMNTPPTVGNCLHRCKTL